MNGKVLVFLFLIALGFLGGHLWKQNIPAKLAETQQAEVIQELPKCNAGICPEYFSMNVDGGNQREEN